MIVQIAKGVFINPDHIILIEEDANEEGEYMIKLLGNTIVYAPAIGDLLRGTSIEYKGDTDA